MKTLQKGFRLLALILMITLASILPVPIPFYRKDNIPKFKIEQIDKKQEDNNKENIKVIS
ncbi:hypothetical protein GCM10023311_08800 [Flaviramulus aquimarinus]|uniref:Uncharacterized protein n=1 Tax=Flaviramulus aquimarinus TaxID=1170456 RepID=A0ABP9F3H9_9FLAO